MMAGVALGALGIPFHVGEALSRLSRKGGSDA